jgi:thioredoxin 1
MDILHASDADLDTIIAEATTAVLVDFWATWCGPCRQVAPVLDAISQERSDVLIVKVDVDESPESAAKYGVRGVPTLIAFRADGEVAASAVGAKPKSILNALIDEAA